MDYEKLMRDVVGTIDFGNISDVYIFTCIDGAVCGFGTVMHAVYPFLNSSNSICVSSVFQGRDTVALITQVASQFMAFLETKVNCNDSSAPYTTDASPSISNYFYRDFFCFR